MHDKPVSPIGDILILLSQFSSSLESRGCRLPRPLVKLTATIRLMEAAGSGTPLYQLKITLRDCKPSIWRKVVVRADMRLDRLHRVFQTVMGWMDSHLHQFVVGSVTYGQPDREWDVEETKMLNEKHHTVIDGCD